VRRDREGSDDTEYGGNRERTEDLGDVKGCKLRGDWLCVARLGVDGVNDAWEEDGCDDVDGRGAVDGADGREGEC
jgi:hypothetical protein